MADRVRPPLRLAIALVAALCVNVRAEQAQPATRPNILLIMTDDLAFQALSAYGSAVNRSPQIDRLAKEGMLFRRCLVGNSICGPSRASILTGKYSHKNGFLTNNDHFDGSQVTFPKLLQKAGYQTAVFGKWHLVSNPTGFDAWQVFPGQGDYYNPTMITPEGRTEVPGYATEIVTKLSLDWLKKERDPNKPFLLLSWHKAPHRNWQPAPKYLNLFKDVKLPEPPTLFDDYSGRGSAAHDQDMSIAKTLTKNDLKLTPPPARLNPEQKKAWEEAYAAENEAFLKADLKGDDLIRWKYQRYMKDYLRCVASVDESVGDLLDYLDESGLAKNTLVAFTSDQGFYLGEHGWFDKRWMYEESLKTALMVRWPEAIKAGSVSDALVSNIDFAPTFLELAGTEVPKDVQGRSFAPILRGNTPADWRKSFYYEYYEFPAPHRVQRHDGVCTDRFKLIHFYDINEWELYDLKADPRELHSLYDDPKHAETVRSLKAELTRLQQKYEVPQPPIETRRFPKQAPAKRKNRDT
jgi:arylsulfatase A-like enzyme